MSNHRTTADPIVHPSKGVPSGMSEQARDALWDTEDEQVARERAKARLKAQQADVEWLARPFVPKDLDKFRSTRVKTNLGDVLKAHS